MDIFERISNYDDARVEPEVILASEERHGPLPTDAFAAIYSSWEARLSDPKTFVNLDQCGVPHWPSFGTAASEFWSMSGT